MGRPSVIEALTPDQRARFILLLRSGSPLNWACKEIGVFSEDTYSDWKKKAEGDGDERYVDFVRDAEQARSQSALSHLLFVGKSDDWRARAWLLERLHPKEFAPLQKQEHSGPEGAPLVGAAVMILPAKEVEEFEAPPPPPPPADDDA